MGLQRFRADTSGNKQKNGATPWFTRWMGGPTLSLLRDCPVKVGDVVLEPRTVYITNHADTYFSMPAACIFKGKRITGYVGSEDGEYYFRAHNDQEGKVK